MIDLGTLGGTLGYPTALNNRGQVVGQSNLAGDLTSTPSFGRRAGTCRIWAPSEGTPEPRTRINDAGEVVGKADFPGLPPDTPRVSVEERRDD